jgi:hypothetical protein
MFSALEDPASPKTLQSLPVEVQASDVQTVSSLPKDATDEELEQLQQKQVHTRRECSRQQAHPKDAGHPLALEPRPEVCLNLNRL